MFSSKTFPQVVSEIPIAIGDQRHIFYELGKEVKGIENFATSKPIVAVPKGGSSIHYSSVISKLDTLHEVVGDLKAIVANQASEIASLKASNANQASEIASLKVRVVIEPC